MNYKHFIIKVFVKKKKEFIFLYFLSIKYENYKKNFTFFNDESLCDISKRCSAIL